MERCKLKKCGIPNRNFDKFLGKVTDISCNKRNNLIFVLYEKKKKKNLAR